MKHLNLVHLIEIMQQTTLYLAMQIVILMGMLLIFTPFSLAEYRDPTVKVNVNKQTDLFEKSIDDLAGYQGEINQDKANNLERIKSGDATNELGMDKGAENQEISNLSNIEAIELNGRGQEKMRQEAPDLYVDYSRLLYAQHKKDARKIAKGQNELLKNLFGKLKELNIDCKVTKGNVEQDPTYYMQIEQERYKDTIYNQTMCEELRNKYSCNDEATLKCLKKGKQYGEWEYRTIRFSGHQMYFQGNTNWGYAVKWKTGRWGWHITPHHPRSFKGFSSSDKQVDSCWRENPAAIIADFRAYLARHLGVMLEQIREDIIFPGRGIGSTHELGKGHRWHVLFSEYEFSYYYRDASDICLEWSEDWNERCRQQ